MSTTAYGGNCSQLSQLYRATMNELEHRGAALKRRVPMAAAAAAIGGERMDS